MTKPHKSQNSKVQFPQRTGPNSSHSYASKLNKVKLVIRELSSPSFLPLVDLTAFINDPNKSLDLPKKLHEFCSLQNMFQNAGIKDIRYSAQFL